MKYILNFYISTFRSTYTVPSMAVFCISLISCFPGMLLSCRLSDFVITITITRITTGITFALTCHMHKISIMRSFYFTIISASLLITFLSPGIAMSINTHVPFLLSRIMISSLLLGIVLLVHTCWFHNIVTLHSWHVSTASGAWSYQSLLPNFYPYFLAYVNV
jgi:hypothetical protein